MKRQDFNQEWEYKKSGTEDWKEIMLPHDAMLYEPRRADAPGGSAVGFFEGGKYIYRKSFFAPENWRGKYVAFEFEGVYRKSVVKLNDVEIGNCKNGYRNFLAEAGQELLYGKENRLTVEVDNSEQPNSRWYSGSGIYRPVHLVVADSAHITLHGLKIRTVDICPAKIQVKVEYTGTKEEISAEIGIYKEGNKITGHTLVSAHNGAGQESEIRFLECEIEIPDAELWFADSPSLYECRASLLDNGEKRDEAAEQFGIRMIEWSTKGLFVNRKSVLLRGACVHHDNGILGAAIFEKSEERRVKILKEQGYNAIRSSHNPASTALVKACDRYGMYLMDETWDMWYGHKNKYDYATDFMNEYQEDIRAVVERDYNHPSVILYSLANEVSEPREEKGIRLLEEMVDLVHALDDSRPVTAGINLMVMELASKGKGVYKEEGGRSDQDTAGRKKKPGKKSGSEEKSGSLFFNMMTSMIGTNMNRMANSRHADQVTSPALDALDIAGYNYASGRYPLEGKAHPDRIVVGTETFPQDIGKNWDMVKKYPYLIGDFMWTGWDYLGEAGIGTWAYGNADGFDKEYPWLLADVGAVDITGYAGAESYYAATVWGLRDRPYIGVQPVNHPGVRPLKSTWRGTNAFDSWSWKGCEGNQAVVEVYSDAEKVQLFLNGKGLGKKKVKNYKAVYRLRYVPGTLTALAYDSYGTEIARTELISAKGKERLAIRPEETSVFRGDIVYVPIHVEGENEIVQCNADVGVQIHVEGGRLLGFGSAAPCTEEKYTSGFFHTYYGRALAVVYAGKAGELKIHAEADNGMQADAVVEVAER